jgi:hypothetical protein
MKAIALIALFLASSISTQAQILIYKNHVVRARTGAGSSNSRQMTGYTLINLGIESVRVDVDPRAKNFSIYSVPYTTNLVRASQRTYAVFAFVDGSDGTNLYSETLKGVTVPTDVGVLLAPPMPVARSLAFTGRQIYISNDALHQPTLQELSGSLSFVPDDTQTANFFHHTIADILDTISNNLVVAGYTKI